MMSPCVQAAGGEGADHDAGPDLQILLGVGDDDGLAGGAAGGVQADHLLHRAGEQAERIGVAQVGLDGERQVRDVVERAQVGRGEAALLHALAEQLHVVVGRAHDGLEAAPVAGRAAAGAAVSPARWRDGSAPAGSSQFIVAPSGWPARPSGECFDVHGVKFLGQMGADGGDASALPGWSRRR